jgi:tRNA (guanine37-N1)-methyltransferase
LTGGEIPAMILIDSIARQIKGVLGNFDSREEERVSSSSVYTRPEILIYKDKKYKVPSILLGGDHKKIEEWKKNNK